MARTKSQPESPSKKTSHRKSGSRQLKAPSAVPRRRPRKVREDIEYAYDPPVSPVLRGSKRRKEPLAERQHLEENADMVQLISNEVCGLRKGVSEMGEMAHGLKRELGELQRGVQMQRAKRERLEAYISYWTDVPQRQPFATLWGPANGMLLVQLGGAGEIQELRSEITSSDDESIAVG